MGCAQIVKASVKGLRLTALTAAVGFLSLTGCRSWFDPGELARDQGDRLVVQILESIDPVDQTEPEFPQAQDVRPQDLQIITTDYHIQANDMITVSIFDLTAGGVETVRTSRVTETGLLSLPMLTEPVRAAGLTEFQLQREIVEQYKRAGILERAQVSVTVVEARGKSFTVVGAVGRPGQYPIVETDFRLLNALVAGGEPTSTQIDYVYVIRKVRSETPSTQPSPVEGGTTPGGPMNPPPQTQPVDIAPRGAIQGTMPILAMMQDLAPAGVAPTTQPTTRPARPGDEDRTYSVEGQTMRLGGGQPTGATPPPAGRTTPPTPPTPGGEATPPAPTGVAPGGAETAAGTAQPSYEFGAGGYGEDQRVIRIPLQPLRRGDLRYNIVIRPGDLIVVPVPTQGFYYMGGHVGAPGVYNIAGQKITLKQAVISARMLDGLAVPQKTDVIRRVGDNSELYVRVNLAKITEGLQPDLYLKPNDVVMVGTDFYAPFLAAFRGAFRITYGFGFLYDRNYAPAQEQRIAQ